MLLINPKKEDNVVKKKIILKNHYFNEKNIL